MNIPFCYVLDTLSPLNKEGGGGGGGGGGEAWGSHYDFPSPKKQLFKIISIWLETIMLRFSRKF